MKIIRPISITSANLTASNVPETPPAAYAGGTTYALGDTVSVTTGTASVVYESLQNANTGNTPASSPAWWQEVATTYAVYSAGTSYALGDVVISTSTNHEYESLANSNLGNALTDATKWLDRGTDNRYRMFDQSNTSTTTRAELIDFTAQVTGRADSVALLNVTAASIQIIASTATDGEVYNETFDLVSTSGITDWYAWFFEPIVRQGDFVATLPAYGDMEVQVLINEPSGTAEIGTAVIGLSREIGGLVYGARIGIQDYSRKQADDFGNYTIIERAFSKRASFKVVCDNSEIDAIAAILAQYRATPVVYIGADDYTSTYVYGFYRDWSSEIAFLTKSYFTFEIEGLT